MTLLYNTDSCLWNIKRVLIGLFILFAPFFSVSGMLPTGPEDSDYLLKSDSVVAEDPYVLNGVSIPVDFPKIDISVSGDTDSGYLFLSNREGPPYIMILKNDGTPYYYRRTDNPSFEFKVQQNGYLSHTLLNDLQSTVGFITMDKNFLIKDTIRAAVGYSSNIHELQILSNGNALIIADSYKSVDMSQIVPGGNPSAIVTGNHIQEFDSLNQLVFNWECWDHFNIEDARNVDLTQSKIDYVHMNSIDVDYDGHILISNRNLNECTKINRQTGEIIWRLGGVNNQFDFIDDSLMISYQHDFRHVEGKPGHYTLFDNGNNRVPVYSRVVEYHIDTTDMSASKIWEFRLDPDKFSKSMGNAQRLPNGNTLMNWAQENLPKAIEVTPEGEVVFEANFTERFRSYRSFRFNWTGKMPAPYLIAEKYPERIRLLFNKFGDTTVNNYRIYAGKHPDSLTFIESTQNSWIDITDIEKETWNYFRVSAIHDNGKESQWSKLDSAFSNFIMAGCNLIYNGDFSISKYLWHLELDQAVSATDTIDNGEFVINVESSGKTQDDIKLIQRNIPLIQNRKYIFEFDAYTDNPMAIKVAFENKRGYPTEYGKIGSVYVNKTRKHFHLSFTMKEISDLNAQLVFYLGYISGQIHLSNISLTEVTEPISVEINTSDITCHGKSDGIISIGASGGYESLSYTLLPDSISNTSGVFEILTAGEYNVEVSDESCKEPVHISNLLIQEPDSLEILNVQLKHLSIDGKKDGEIVVTASGGSGDYNYVLYPDSIQNSTGVFMNLSSGKYHIVLDDEYGCGPVVSNELTLLNLTSLGEIVETDLIGFYPNPGMDKVHLWFSDDLGKFSLSIVNQQGGIVKTLQVENSQYPNNEFELNLNDLESGLYFIRIIGIEKRSGHPIHMNQKLIIL